MKVALFLDKGKITFSFFRGIVFLINDRCIVWLSFGKDLLTVDYFKLLSGSFSLNGFCCILEGRFREWIKARKLKE
jgi:hypothetical protein